RGMKEIEIYEDGRFFTFTGHRIDGRPQSVNVCRESLHEVCHWAFTDEDDEEEPTPSSNGTPKRDLSETEIWDLIEQADDDKIQRLWSGDTSLNDHDHSRADSALCCKLYFYGADKHQIDELFRQSGLMRPKWDEQRGNQTYGEMTIQNAIDEVDERHSALTDDSAGDSRTANGAPSGDGQAGNAPGMPNSAPFWYFDAEKEKTKIERAGLIQFLEDHGFGKLYAESDLDSMLVRVEDNIVRHTSREKIKDFVLGYVRKVQPKREAQVIDALLRGANVYFSDALFEFLSPVEPDFHEDTPEKAFFYYENGFVEVTADGFDLQPYSDLDGVIWEDQIINREFETLTDEGPSGWDWHEHLLNVAGHDKERHNAICTGLGYLMHDYKDPAVTKAIIFMDEKVTDVEEGRTGKSVTTEALQYMGSTLRVDGRNFSFDSRFAFQEVTLDTAVVDFNDAKKRFPFERLFSLITDDFPVERKGKDRVTIPFEDSPKFALSTNYVIEGKGASFQDRTFQVEFADYYSPRHSPKDEFGHRLFDDWDADEWARFDNVMMACVRQYLRDGLASYDHVNIQEKKLRQETCPDFAEWIRDFIELGRRYDKKALKKSFQEAYAPDYEDMTGYQCTTWVKTFARIYDLDVSEPKSGSTRYIVLRDTDEK
ncbi:hypothetical protein, partial [Salinibacter ruber]|uniref:phage NrS-1 polymerase family protein n=1 Tax=Salinibacter ruber TaxID=146919 RepID=UPI00207347F4